MKPDERKTTEDVRVVKDRNDKDRHKHRSKPRLPHNGKRKTRSDKNDKMMWPNKRIISALTVVASRNTSWKIVLPLEKYARHATNETTSRQSADQHHAHRKLNRWHRFQTRRKQKCRKQNLINFSSKSKKCRPCKPKGNSFLLRSNLQTQLIVLRRPRNVN